jgi:hypothetical protein
LSAMVDISNPPGLTRGRSNRSRACHRGYPSAASRRRRSSEDSPLNTKGLNSEK